MSQPITVVKYCLNWKGSLVIPLYFDINDGDITEKSDFITDAEFQSASVPSLNS